MFLNYTLHEPPGFRKICQLEKIHNKQLKQSVLNETTFQLEDDDGGMVAFNGETLSFFYSR